MELRYEISRYETVLSFFSPTAATGGFLDGSEWGIDGQKWGALSTWDGAVQPAARSSDIHACLTCFYVLCVIY